MKRYKLEDADRWLNAVGMGMREAAERGLLSAAQRTVEHIQAEIIPATDPLPVDRGVYKAGWRAEKMEGGAIVTNNVPYAPVIEDGAKAENIHPGRAMIEAIAEWVRRKGIGGRLVTRKDGTTRVSKPSATEALGIAFAIVRSMQLKGIFQGKGLKVFDRASKKIPDFIREEVAREIKREFSE